MLDHKKTAVIILDVQNDFCDDEGAFAIFLGWKTTSIKAMVPRLEKFIDRMRDTGALIVLSQMINDKIESPRNLQEKLSSGAEKDAAQWPFGLERGSWGWRLYKLRPKKTDIILDKNYYDLFSNPQLKEILQKHKIDTLIVTGLYTEVCVFGTVERAFTEGYRVIVPNDLIGSIDEREGLKMASLEIMQNYLATVVDSSRLT